jgi:hypothetical protein
MCIVVVGFLAEPDRRAQQHLPGRAGIGRLAVDVEVVLLVEQIARRERHADPAAPPRCRRVHERIAGDQKRIIVAANSIAHVLHVERQIDERYRPDVGAPVDDVVGRQDEAVPVSTVSPPADSMTNSPNRLR